MTVTVAVTVPVILVKPVGHTSVYTVVVVVTYTLEGHAPHDFPDVVGPVGLEVVDLDGSCQADQLCTGELLGSTGFDELGFQADQECWKVLLVGSLGLVEVVGHAPQPFLPVLVVGSTGLEEVLPIGH